MHVLGTLVGQLLGHGGRTAVHLVGVPAGARDVLRVAMVPVGRVARIVVVVVIARLALLGGIAGGKPGAVGVLGVAEPLGVHHEHAGGEHDLVVVAEHTLDGGRVLEGVARYVGVEHVETTQPPAVDHGLIDVVFRSVHIGSVIDPPLVVGGHGILVGGGSILKVAGVTGLIFLGGVRQFVGDQAELNLDGLRFVGLEAQRAGEFATADDPVGTVLVVGGEARIDGRQVVLDVHAASKFGGTISTLGGERRGRGQCDIAVLRAFHGEVRNHHVVVGDVLNFLDLEALATGLEQGGEVARCLLALGGVFVKGLVCTVSVYGNGKAIPVGLIPVGGVTHKTEPIRRVRVHVGGATTGEQVVVAVGAFIRVRTLVVRAFTSWLCTSTGENLIDPEVMVGVGAGQVLHVVIECLLQIAGGRVICGVVRRRLHRIIRPLERRICHIRILDDGRIGCLRGDCTAGGQCGDRCNRAD